MITAELNYDTNLTFYGDTKTVLLLYSLMKKIEKRNYDATECKIKYLKELLEKNIKKINDFKAELKKPNNGLIYRLINRNIKQKVVNLRKEILELEDFNYCSITPKINKLEGYKVPSKFLLNIDIKDMLTTLGFSCKVSNIGFSPRVGTKNHSVYEYDGDEELLRQRANQEITKLEEEIRKKVSWAKENIDNLIYKQDNLTPEDIYNL